ncbi:hypothetical protein, partial [Agromyces humi]|uniref:hypothetical protein n=1 Tax=Agromyces humi TaxID=1766800 RepID=UPI001356A87E
LEVAGQEASLSYLLEPGTPTVWHHRPLGEYLLVGEAVVVHERYNVVRAGGTVLSVEIADGLGPVPEPKDELLRVPDAPVVANLRSGIGTAVGGSTRRWRAVPD